uniref:C-type lectin domain-containing protein n=1 Tax=Amphiprion percula TaxID=161767 RepID=A0A3P8TTB4_AMPPE
MFFTCTKPAILICLVIFQTQLNFAHIGLVLLDNGYANAHCFSYDAELFKHIFKPASCRIKLANFSVFVVAFCLSNPGPQCDLSNGWRQYGSNCYKLKADVRKSWNLARHDCVFEGGDLVSITTAEENQFVSLIQQSPTGISLWMGGHDSVTEGGWEWTDGSPFRYIRWNAGNPDNYDGEDCLSILVSNGYWNDDKCENKRGYICNVIYS